MLIKPITNIAYDCFTSNLISASRFLNRNYYLWFSNMIGYKNYSRQEKYEELEKIHGLRCHEYKYSSMECGLLVENNLMKGIPTIIETDIYQCPWNRYYQQQHNQHFLLITGYQDGQFTCLDTYVSADTYSFTWEEIALPFMVCTTFETKEPHENLKEIFTVIIKYLLRYEKELSGQTLNAQSLSKGIMDRYDLDTEYDIAMHEPIRQIKIHEDGRCCYLEMIQKIQQQFDIDLSVVQSYLTDTINILRKIKRIALVYILSTNREQKDINTYIQNIIDIDRSMIGQMKNIIYKVIGDSYEIY